MADAELVDRVAEALQAEFSSYRDEGRRLYGLSTEWADLPDGRREEWRRMARAGLEAAVGDISREAAPYSGMSMNRVLMASERLGCARKALEIWERLES